MFKWLRRLFNLDTEDHIDNMHQARMLGNYTDLINTYGVDSEQSKKFLEENKDDKDLISYCESIRRLRINLGKGNVFLPRDKR